MHISIAAEKIFSIGNFSVTNTLLMAWFVAGLLIASSVIFLRRPALVPAGFQNLFEYATESFVGLMQGVLGGRERAERFFPFIVTIFLFILASNWIGLLPVLGTVGLFAPSHADPSKTVFVPLLRSAASDLNFTLALSIISVVAIQIIGVASIGFFKYAGKFITFKSPLDFFVGILELISESAKLVSFSFRLFGNIFAGEVLLIIVGVLVPFAVPVPFIALEFFSGFVQALVFSLLTLMFIAIATVEHH